MTMMEAPQTRNSGPSTRSAYLFTGQAFLRAERFEEAVACFEMALSVDPGDPHAWNCKAATLGMIGRRDSELDTTASLRYFDDALACLDRALNLNPHHAGAWFNKGLLLAEVGRPSDAIAALQRALRLGAGGARAALERLREEDQQEGSRACAEEWARRGRMLAAAGRSEEASDCFLRAVELDSTLAVAWFDRGALLAISGRIEEARSCFRAARRERHPLASAALQRCRVLAERRSG